MPYTLAKIAAFLCQPSSLAAMALLTGLMLLGRNRRPKLASRLAWGGLAYIAIAGLLPAGNLLMLPLEQRFAGLPPPRPEDRYTGIIILGGFEDGWVTEKRGLLAVNESAERLTEGLRLALRLPATQVVFTGGVGGLWPGGRDAAEPIRTFLSEAGVAKQRILVEARSRNTAENAQLTYDLLQSKAGQRWLLVTSAYHMPRAIGLFRKAGFDVTAYPVDYRTRGPEDLLRPFERIPAGLLRMDLAANEWLGLIAYRIMGRIDDLLPAP